MKPRSADKRFGSPYGKGEPVIRTEKRKDPFHNYPGLEEWHSIPYNELRVEIMPIAPNNDPDRLWKDRLRAREEAERIMQQRQVEEMRWQFIKRMEEDLYRQRMPPPQIIRQNHQYRKLPPPPTHYLIQYIGGPFNAQQEFIEVAKAPAINQGVLWTKSAQPDVTKDYDILNPPPVQTFQYRLTFIPMNETPFSDAQIAIGIYQE